MDFTENKFPRDFGKLPKVPYEDTRFCCYDFEHLKQLIDRYIFDKSLYVGTYPYSVIMSPTKIVDKLVFDFDAHSENETIDGALKQTRRLYDYIESQFGGKPLVVFTGRGFHEHVYFDNTKLSHYYYSVRQLIKKIRNDLGINGEDMQYWDQTSSYTSNSNSMVRLIYSFNQRTEDKKLVRIVDINDIDDESFNPVCFKKCNNELGKMVESIDMLYESKNQTVNKQVEYNGNKAENIQKELGYLMKIADKIEFADEFDGRHRTLWLMIIPRLVLLKKDDKEIHDWCQSWIVKTGRKFDIYANHITYWIERTRNGGWMPWGFKTFFMEFPDIFQIFSDKTADEKTS